MNMKRRHRTLSGLQQRIVDLEHEPNKQERKPKQKSKKLEPIVVEQTEAPAEEENIIFDGKEIYSHHPKIKEVFQMTDESNNPPLSKRAVGVDIGTGFISCAEEEGGNIKFRKIRD